MVEKNDNVTPIGQQEAKAICETCPYWTVEHEDGRSVSDDKDLGACRAKPPEYKIDNGPDGSQMLETIDVHTDRNYWCGSHPVKIAQVHMILSSLQPVVSPCSR